MQFVQRANTIYVSVRRGPVVYVRGELLRLSPQYPTARVRLRILPLSMPTPDEIAHHHLDVLAIELPSDGRVLPQRALVHDQRFDFQIGVCARCAGQRGRVRKVVIIGAKPVTRRRGFVDLRYRNISSLHCANCFSLVDSTGCMVKKGGK